MVFSLFDEEQFLVQHIFIQNSGRVVMSGEIGVTIRLGPDEVYKMRWGVGGVNILQSYAFLESTPDYRAAKRAIWSDRKLAGPMAPHSYGLIVADFVTGKLLGAQSHMDLTSLSVRRLFGLGEFNAYPNTVDPPRLRETHFTSPDYYAEKRDVLPLIASGRITHLERSALDSDAVELEPLSSYGATPEEIVRRLPETLPKPSMELNLTGVYLPLSLIPFNDVRVSHELSVEEWVALREELKAMGLELTEEDRAAWTAWLETEEA